MPIPVTVPRLGWSMDEGTFAGWLKADGDAVRPGDLLFKLEGEKSVEEVETFDAGVLSIPADAPKQGDRVAVGAVLGWLLQVGESAGSPLPTAVSPTRERGAVASPAPLTPNPSPAAGRVERTRISPRARRLAEQHGIDWTQLNGTGSNGRIRERDVAAVPDSGVIRLSPIRRTTAARMVESRQRTAPVTLTATADAANLVNLRGQFKAAGGVVPAYTDFLLKLVAVALQQHPLLAARWTDAGLQPAARIDIGLAVDTDAGLLVPVVRDVPAFGLRQLAEHTRELAARARQGTLTAAEMSGGCFTVTSLGAFGVEFFTPIINHPECAILGVGAIKRVPVMDGDRVVGREQLPLSLTFDHRVADGAPAAKFLQTLCELIANPAPWLAT
jgi:pyruvate dehydrogenase E2 component (dihydrolipoamide acetyltransferase)